MPNSYFQFKHFRIDQDLCGMKVTTDGCFMGAVVPVEEGMKVLDIGTGTGLLSLMLAQRADIQIHAVEIDKKAFEQAKSNFQVSPWSERIEVYNSPLQSFESTTQYELIICNPPFFKASQKGQQENKNKALHAQHLSMEDLAIHAKRLLAPEAAFWVMYPAQEMNEFIAIAQNQGFSPESAFILRNTPNSPVFRKIVKFTFNETDTDLVSEIAIRNVKGEYTDSFNALLKDYYLHL